MVNGRDYMRSDFARPIGHRRIRVLIADGDQMVLEGLRLLLGRYDIIEVVGEATNGRATVELANHLVPDVVVMGDRLNNRLGNVAVFTGHLNDAMNFNGLAATQRIRNINPTIQIIGLSAVGTAPTDRWYVLRMLDAGASGYVLKCAAATELIQAIAAVSRGKKYLGSGIPSGRRSARILHSVSVFATKSEDELTAGVLSELAELKAARQAAEDEKLRTSKRPTPIRSDFCSNCGKGMKARPCASFCPRCGSRLREEEPRHDRTCDRLAD